MRLHQTASDRQAETRAAGIGRLDEAVEDDGQHLVGDPGSGVGDAKHDRRGVAERCLRRCNLDASSSRRVTERVLQHVREHLADP